MSDDTKVASAEDVEYAIRAEFATAKDPIQGSRDALAAARSLGCLLPEDAAALERKYDAARDLYIVECRRRLAIEDERDQAIEAAHAATLTRNQERDALAARVRVLEEALRKVAGIANECTWTPNTRLLANELADIVGAALTPAEVTALRQAAWRAGAEAMREAAAGVADGALPKTHDSLPTASQYQTATYIWTAIRALTLPTPPATMEGGTGE